MSNSKILFLVSGSISAYKAADVVSKLVQKNYEVQVVFSESAERFVGKMTFEGLTGRPVLQDIFENGQAMAHIDLARWADLFVLCPASAQKLSELAQGAATDLISTLFLAKKPEVPALIFPAMNSAMWAHPFVQRNKETINSLPNVRAIEPQEGNLACGETGAGRLPEPAQVVEEIEAALSKKTSSKKILITGGGTSEPIDSVRSVTNTSSGATAGLMADHFSGIGHRVDLLFSQSSRFTPKTKPVDEFTSHSDLSEKLKKYLSSNEYDAVVHLAAVSDFSPVSQSGKISSENESLVIEMKRTAKIISSLREWSKNKEALILGFKLTVNTEPKKRQEIASELIKNNSLNGVISNDLSEISTEAHKGFLLTANGRSQEFGNKKQMFKVIEQFLEEKNDSLS